MCPRGRTGMLDIVLYNKWVSDWEVGQLKKQQKERLLVSIQP